MLVYQMLTATCYAAYPPDFTSTNPGCAAVCHHVHPSSSRWDPGFEGIYPIPSMYGRFTSTWVILWVNVGKYTMHGLHG